MTVDTPFPDRPATPYWSPRGMFASGIPQYEESGMGDWTGNIQSPSTGVRILDAITAGSIAAERAIMGQQIGGCPINTAYNPGTQTCLPVLSGSVTASASNVVWIALAIGAALLIFGRGKR